MRIAAVVAFPVLWGTSLPEHSSTPQCPMRWLKLRTGKHLDAGDYDEDGRQIFITFHFTLIVFRVRRLLHCHFQKETLSKMSTAAVLALMANSLCSKIVSTVRSRG